MNNSSSSYLQYLPPVLWVKDGQVLDFIGRFLLIFEKILTGVDDDVKLTHNEHSHSDFESTIDKLHTLFDPWQTPTDFLPYLASWVALELEPSWDEYQQRKVISEIVSIYQLRGLKKGLYKYLEIYNISKAQPRVVIDDGDAIFRIVLNNGFVETVQPLASSKPLLHPNALAIDDYGNYIIADQGDEDIDPPVGPVPAALWNYSPTGDPSHRGSPVPPLKAIHQGAPLFTPTAVVVETTGSYVVLEIGPDVPLASPPVSGIYRFSPPGLSPPSPVIDQTTVPGFPAVYPVDMVRIADGHFVVLDRGARSPNPTAPQIIVVKEGPPLTVDIHPLTNISEPTSIALDSSGNFIITDAGLGPPTPAEPTGALLQADIFLVDISTPPATETSLLRALPADENPLIYPTSVVLEDADHILVSDLGVKPPGRHARLAEPAALYLIPLPPAAPRVELISRDRSFVWPSDIAVNAQSEIIMLDHGESQDQFPERSWRAMADEFGVIIYFSEERPVPIGEKQRIVSGISRIVNAEKPAHSYGTLKNNQL